MGNEVNEVEKGSESCIGRRVNEAHDFFAQKPRLNTSVEKFLAIPDEVDRA